jgi:hypothetical protein
LPHLNRKFQHAPHCHKVCSPTQKQRPVNMCLELQEEDNEDPTFISRIIMGYESWISVMIQEQSNNSCSGTKLRAILKTIKENDSHGSFEM